MVTINPYHLDIFCQVACIYSKYDSLPCLKDVELVIVAAHNAIKFISVHLNIFLFS